MAMSKRRSTALGIGLAWWCLAGLTAAAADNKPAAVQPIPAAARGAKKLVFASDIKPLLTKYCGQCHTGEKARAGVAFDTFADDAAVRKSERSFWQTVLDNIDTGAMPPAGKPRPTQAERDLIAQYIDREVLQIDCSGPVNPGRVTIRRLNRAEYNHTIRDLLGVDFHPADDFPTDDVGYGFDNIGDVLSMPTILLEKYMDAAEKIVDMAIIRPDVERAPTKTYEPAKLAATVGVIYNKTGRNLYSDGEVHWEHEFPKSGEYLVRVKAFGQQAGDDPCHMEFRLNKKKSLKVDVKAVEGDSGTYDWKHPFEKGKHRLSVAFTNDFFDPFAKDGKNKDRNLVIEEIEIQGPLGGKPEKLPASHTRLITCQPTPHTRSACARVILRPFVTRAFRRPVTDAELQRLLNLVDLAEQNGDSFERGIQLAIQGVLVSPHFLFRIEQDPSPQDPGGIRTISDYELATRISYFLWSSLPDDELLRHAEQGTLRKNGNLDAQVRRMLKDPKTQALVENFAGQWLQLRNLKTFNPDKKQFPQFDEALRTAMQTETEMFFASILKEDRNLLELLDTNYSFVNERLAKHYGLADIKGAEFRKVTFATPERGGLLGHASFLTVTSNPTRTSPVKRGKWILENLLASPPPPPPPDVPELAADDKGELTGSLRQRMEQHRTNPVCASCHQRMDPLGFGLENFDALGSWRTQDGKFPIDASGTLPSGQTFQGPAELKAILKTREADFRKCVVEKMLTYALGRGLEFYDKCAIDRISNSVAKSGNKPSALVLEIIHSDPFQKRKR